MFSCLPALPTEFLPIPDFSQRASGFACAIVFAARTVRSESDHSCRESVNGMDMLLIKFKAIDDQSAAVPGGRFVHITLGNFCCQ
jgi:hypothetical protein